MLSSFSLISLVGVMLGVLVLVVVMAVYSGLERNVKDRLLGYVPHVLLNENFPNSPDGRMIEWTDAAARAKKLPHVESATAFVYDYVMVDVEERGQRAVMFRGIDTSDPAQVAGVTKMLDMENFPGSSADLGLDDRVVISSLLADDFKIGVGDKIRLLSTKNIKEVMGAYKATDHPPLREAYAQVWEKSTAALRNGWKAEGGKFILTAATDREVYAALVAIYDEGLQSNNIREPEQELLGDLLRAMDAAESSDTEFHFEPEAKTAVEKAIADLNSTDVEKMNNEARPPLRPTNRPR